MGVYNYMGETVSPYDVSGNPLSQSYDVNGNELLGGYTLAQKYLGGYIEIQPDSWDGNVPVNGDIVQPSDSTAWGFPSSLSATSKTLIKSDILSGNGFGIMFIRFPLGFAYRGYRNIDATTGLAKNIGERWSGQNSALASWFDDISNAGGGLAPEYWCLPPYWLTGGAYYSQSGNRIWAGGSYSRSTTLASIRMSDMAQYNAQVDALTDAIIDDLEYLHQNVAPVRMFGLANEPNYGSQRYGACQWEAQTYNDVLEVLYPKIKNSNILSVYDGQSNTVLLHVASDDSQYFTSEALTYISNHADDIWGYSYHGMRRASGEEGNGADSFYKSSDFSYIKGNKDNVFINEYEYFSTSSRPNEFRFANNLVHLIDEMVYGGAQVLHPIIHICKPKGQTAYETNTTGYCLYAVDMSDGSFDTNVWAYNSWKMFNDNLPINSYRVTNYSVNVNNVGFLATVHNGVLRLFMANSGNTDATFSVDFGKTMTFDGLRYDLTNLGTPIEPVSGQTITFTIPAYSGLCWMEEGGEVVQKRIKDLSLLPSVPANGNLVVDTATGTGRVTIEDIKDYILPADGIVLKSPNNTRFKITVANDGTLTATEITE